MPTAFVNPATQVDAHDSCSGWLKSISGDWLFLLMLVPDIGESRQGATPDNSPRRESGEGLANANSESLGDDRAFFGSCATMLRHTAFSIGMAQVETTIRYIKNQERHHRRLGFQQEMRSFVEKHGLTWREDDEGAE